MKLKVKVGDKLYCIRTIKYDDKDDFLLYGEDKIIFGNTYEIVFIDNYRFVIRGERGDVHFRRNLLHCSFRTLKEVRRMKLRKLENEGRR